MADIKLELRQNLFIRQPVPEKGIVCSNVQRATRLASSYLLVEEKFSCSWGAEVWIGTYSPSVSDEKFFIAIAPVGSGSGLVFQELFSAGCKYLVRYGSDDVQNPEPQEYSTVKLIDEADNLYGFCQASGLPESEWGKSVQASSVLLDAFEREAKERHLSLDRRICHHLENYHALRNPETYPNREIILRKQLESLKKKSCGKKESFDMESAVLFRVAVDSGRHAISILQTVHKEDSDCDPYEGRHGQEALELEQKHFVDYIFQSLMRVRC